MDGVSGLLNHDRVGLRKIKAVLNSKLSLIGLLPTMVEAVPFQKANFLQVVERYYPLLIRLGDGPGAFPFFDSYATSWFWRSRLGGRATALAERRCACTCANSLEKK